jgi:predicted kinase
MIPLVSARHWVIAFSGAVGSGKTYVASRLVERLGAIHLNTDMVRIALRKRGESESRAIQITEERFEKLLRSGAPVILDHDIPQPERHEALRRRLADRGYRLYTIAVETPERLILARLRRKRYTARDLFRNAEEAVRVYRIRKAFRDTFHVKRFTPSFTVDNGRPIGSQLKEIAATITGL